MGTKVLIWNEYVHERENPEIAPIYDAGIHTFLAERLDADRFAIDTATLQDDEQGLSEERLANTDVLVWWSHAANDEVRDSVASRVVERVLDGMGFIALHAAKNSKPFARLMGTSRRIKYRHAAERERLWVVDSGHPIANGLDEYFEIPETEMYGEPYDIPEPDRTVLISWFPGGEVFRSGVCYRRGRGRVFAFRPGHEEYPVYDQSSVISVINNAIAWARPTTGATATYGASDPIERLER